MVGSAPRLSLAVEHRRPGAGDDPRRTTMCANNTTVRPDKILSLGDRSADPDVQRDDQPINAESVGEGNR